MPLGLGRVIHGRQGVKIPVVGGQANFGITVEVGHGLGHGKPAVHLLSFSFAAASNFKFIGTVDNGLDAQYAAVLIVHFYTVFFHPVFNSRARTALFIVAHHLSIKAPVELFSEKAKYILGAEDQGGKLQQFFIQGL